MEDDDKGGLLVLLFSIFSLVWFFYSLWCYSFIFPDNTDAIPEGKTYPGAKLILTPPATPVPVTIDEVMVIRMQCEYKSHFPKESNDKQRS